MKLLSIVPISRGMRKDTLTYFTTNDIAVGTLVTIPLRKKQVPGLVLESNDAKESKSIIKDMQFSLRKIIDIKSDVALPEFIMHGAEHISVKSASTIGSVVASLIPKLCLENPELFFKKGNISPIKSEGGFIHNAIQSDNTDRIDTYRSLIRESFAKGKSIVVIGPTIEKVQELEQKLSKGIADYTVALHKMNSKKHLTSAIDKMKSSEHPMLIITTPYGLSFIKENTGTIILEEESSPYYKSRRRPYLDTRTVVEEIAKTLGITLIFGDKLLSILTLAEIQNGTISEYGRIERRNLKRIDTHIISVKKKEGDKKPFSALGDELLETIRYVSLHKKSMLIYATRRGLAPLTVCHDCGTVVLCPNCESPFVLHTTGEKRLFICHHCGQKQDTLVTCTHCTSWNLVPLGIGIERIEEEVKQIISERVFRIDADVCKNIHDIKSIVDSFKHEGGILITTDLGIPFIDDDSIDYTAVPSIESMLALPDFRTNERIMHTILDLKSKTREVLLIQTRNQHPKTLDYALSGDLESFMNEEIQARKEFGYPPFETIVKISVESKKETIKAEVASIVNTLSEFKPIIFPAFIKSPKNRKTLNILIKLSRQSWPHRELIQKLLGLPPHIKIDTSPTSIL